MAGHIEALQTLGNEIIAGMKSDKPYIEEIFMDKDFKDRTVLHLISYNNFSELMSDSKVTVLLDNLW